MPHLDQPKCQHNRRGEPHAGRGHGVAGICQAFADPIAANPCGISFPHTAGNDASGASITITTVHGQPFVFAAARVLQCRARGLWSNRTRCNIRASSWFNTGAVMTTADCFQSCSTHLNTGSAIAHGRLKTAASRCCRSAAAAASVSTARPPVCGSACWSGRATAPAAPAFAACATCRS